MQKHVAPIGLRAVALFEAAKGTLVLLAGFGVFALFHTDAQHMAERIVRHFHLDPASHYPQIFLHLAEQATPAHLWWLAAGALGYASLRFAEAYGLWHERHWAEWLAVLSSGIYLPVEIWEVSKGVTWLRVTFLLANLSIAIYLGLILVRNARQRRRLQSVA